MGYYTDFHGNFKLTGKEDVLAGLVPVVNEFARKRHHAPGDPNEYNTHMPKSFWCDWDMRPWGGEYFLATESANKFYCYAEWLQYLIDHYFAPNGVMVNGEVEWIGEAPNDRGKMVVKDNVLKVLKAKITYVEA